MFDIKRASVILMVVFGTGMSVFWGIIWAIAMWRSGGMFAFNINYFSEGWAEVGMFGAFAAIGLYAIFCIYKKEVCYL